MRLARKDNFEPTPICRCRVLYLGSAVPQITKDGLQGIQEPLRELYPAEGAVSAKGIDSWLSVWSNGLLLENVDENQKKVTRFFTIESLHYCAAVRYVVVSGTEGAPTPRFLPLDSPFARNPSINHPPLFACILRRTTGIKVLECHAFICKRETPANALVRCCFHAYADSMCAKSLETNNNSTQEESLYGGRATEEVAIEVDYTGDLSSANSEILPNSIRSSPVIDRVPKEDEISIYNGDENHKVWAGPSKPESEVIYADYGAGTLRSAKSNSSIYGTAGPSKSSRPRQMIMPSAAPPPPPSESGRDNKKEEHETSRTGNEKRMMNGKMNGRILPANGIIPHSPNGLPLIYPSNGNSIRSSNGFSESPKKGRLPRMFNSLAERRSKAKKPVPPFAMMQHGLGHQTNGHHPHSMPFKPPHPLINHPPIHPMMQANIGPPMPPPHMMPHHPPPLIMGPHGPMPPLMRRPMSRAIEEPIYMPSSRPLSPTASYQPGHFPHEQYLFQQYATTSRPKHKKKKKKKGKEDDEDIYGRKGHINERAFSQSIREEHRSQSIASLVDGSHYNSKKDREMIQMVTDLDLSGDELERSEARPGMYKPHPASNGSGTIISRISARR